MFQNPAGVTTSACPPSRRSTVGHHIAQEAAKSLRLSISGNSTTPTAGQKMCLLGAVFEGLSGRDRASRSSELDDTDYTIGSFTVEMGFSAVEVPFVCHQCHQHLKTASKYMIYIEKY